MKEFNYEDFREAINDQFLYLDMEEAIDDILQPILDGTMPPEDMEDIFSATEEYFGISCMDKINDPQALEIVKEAAATQIENLREMFS